MNYLERKPIRLKYIKESLKQYHLIKKNKYLDRKKKNLTDDENFICSCLPSLETNLKLKKKKI